MMENIEIFDGIGSKTIRRRRHGAYFHVNMKNRHVLMSNDARIAVFGLDRFTPSKLIFVHSKIERKWYVAEPKENTLFGSGYEAKPKDTNNRSSVWTVNNGAAEVLKKMIAEVNGGKVDETHTIAVGTETVDYEGMKLFPLTLNA